jgi:RNA polymerase sigma factor (sigma-70 family)
LENRPELIDLLRSGSPKAVEEVFYLYKDRVYNTVLSIVKNREDAEEITTDVFLEVFRSAPGFKAGSLLSTWIYRISVNKALDHLKYLQRKKRFAWLSGLFHPGTHEPIQQAVDFNHPGVMLERKEQAALLFRALEQLPDKQQAAFVLFEMEQLSYKEISSIMNTTESAVESLLSRARAGLRRQLSDLYKGKQRRN